VNLTGTSPPYDGYVSSLPAQRTNRRWFVALICTFALNGLFFATWVSRTPETEQRLGLSTVSYGLFAMVLGFGALMSVVFGSRLLSRWGSRRMMLASFVGMGVFFALTGLAISAGNLPLAVFSNLGMGLFFGMSNFANNIEATDVDRASSRSLLPPLHGAYSAGLLAGSALGAASIAVDMSLWLDFALVSVATVVVGFVATRFIPRDGVLHTPEHDHTGIALPLATPAQRRAVWREPRTLGLAAIALAFVLAEYTAATWLPIYLVSNGMTPEEGAIGFTCFAVTMAVGRLFGGFVVERMPRPVLLSLLSIVCVVGIVLVMLMDVVGLVFVGATLWGLGASLGYPLVSSALAEDPVRSPARIRVLLVFMNSAILGVGPALGAVGQAFGLMAAIAIPGLALVVAGSTTRVARPLPPSRLVSSTGFATSPGT
jgi:predicted MFS family arabinose efflux permease